LRISFGRSARLGSVVVLAIGWAGWGTGFGPDQRIPAPQVRPYTGVVRVKVGNAVGCGFLVGPDLMVTAAHVVSNPQGETHPDIRVECGVLRDKPRDVVSTKEVVVGRPLNPDPASGRDWAVVRLDRPAGLVYGWTDCLELSNSELKSLPVELVSFAGVPDEPRTEFANFQAPYSSPGSVRDVGPEILFHDCAAWGGSSGGALLSFHQGQLRVVAVNSAGVEFEGEKLERGFRRVYSKELGNIAVPARQFGATYRSMFRESKLKCRQLWIRNNFRFPIRVSVRHHAVLADKKQPFRVIAWQEIPSQRRVRVLSKEDGCADDEVFLALTNLQEQPVGPSAAQEFEVDGQKRKFFRKFIGTSEDYTATYP